MSKSIFFKTPNIFKDLNNPGNIIQEEQMNFSNNSKFCDILAFSSFSYFHPSLSSTEVALKTVSPVNTMKTGSLDVTEGEKLVLEP